MRRVIIVGASHAGSQAAVSLRQGGWDGEIMLVGEETDIPYHRPPLSKEILSGDKTLDDILIRPQNVYETAHIQLKLHTRVIQIDPKSKYLIIDNEEKLDYDKLILSTGARVRRLDIPGASLSGVFYLRTLKDVLAIKDHIQAGQQALIIGGGYIGLETAASLKKAGLNVTILEAMDRILQRVTAPGLSQFYKRIHREEGVIIHENFMATQIRKHDKGLEVQTQSGDNFSADIVIIGIGVIPNIDLAQTAGLEVGNGIHVNEFCQTSDPDIYAAGDVTWHYNPIYDRHIRLESVPNATEQAKIVAAHINGQAKPYHSLPWFWSDQFDLKLQIAGLSQGYNDIIIRGDIESGRSVAAFYFLNSRLLAVDAINRPREFMVGKMALTQGRTLDKTILPKPNTNLKSALI